MLRALEAEGRGIVEAAGVTAADIEVRRSADMRYVGQGFEIRVELPEVPFDERMASRIEEAFEAEYQRLYGRLCAGVPIESVHWRVAVSGPRPRSGRVEIRRDRSVGKAGALKGRRGVVFAAGEGSLDVPVYDRYLLEEGFSIEEPAIIEEAESTTVVRPDWQCRVGENGELLLTRPG